MFNLAELFHNRKSISSGNSDHSDLSTSITSPPSTRGSARRGKRGRPPGVRSARTLKVDAKPASDHHPPPPPIAGEKMTGIAVENQNFAKSKPVSSFTVSVADTENTNSPTGTPNTTTPPSFLNFPSSVPSSTGLPPVSLFNMSETISLPQLPNNVFTERKQEPEEDEDDYDNFDE